MVLSTQISQVRTATIRWSIRAAQVKLRPSICGAIQPCPRECSRGRRLETGAGAASLDTMIAMRHGTAFWGLDDEVASILHILLSADLETQAFFFIEVVV